MQLPGKLSLNNQLNSLPCNDTVLTFYSLCSRVSGFTLFYRKQLICPVITQNYIGFYDVPVFGFAVSLAVARLIFLL